MLEENELLFDELYEKTKDCGRVQFINLLMKKERENRELKKQLKEIDTFINNSGFANIEQVMLDYCHKLSQQKEFIERVEANLEALEMCDREFLLTNNKKEIKVYKEILSKYKEIIGVKDE